MDSIMGIISLALHTIRILNDMLGRMCDNASLRIQGFAWLEFDSSVPEEFYHPIIPVPLPAGSERKQKPLKFYLSGSEFVISCFDGKKPHRSYLIARTIEYYLHNKILYYVVS